MLAADTDHLLPVCMYHGCLSAQRKRSKEINQNDNGDIMVVRTLQMVSLHWCSVMVKVVRGNDGRVLMVVSVVVASVVMCEQT